MTRLLVGDRPALGTLPSFDCVTARSRPFAAQARRTSSFVWGLLASRVCKSVSNVVVEDIWVRWRGIVADPDMDRRRTLVGLPDPESNRRPTESTSASERARRESRRGFALRTTTPSSHDITLARAWCRRRRRGTSRSSLVHPCPCVTWSGGRVEGRAHLRQSRCHGLRRGVDDASAWRPVQSGGLIGDITMLHDVSGLVDGWCAGGSCALVVADNQGEASSPLGPSFAGHDSDASELLFGTPRHHDLRPSWRGRFGHEGVT